MKILVELVSFLTKVNVFSSFSMDVLYRSLYYYCVMYYFGLWKWLVLFDKSCSLINVAKQSGCCKILYLIELSLSLGFLLKGTRTADKFSRYCRQIIKQKPSKFFPLNVTHMKKNMHCFSKFFSFDWYFKVVIQVFAYRSLLPSIWHLLAEINISTEI